VKEKLLELERSIQWNSQACLWHHVCGIIHRQLKCLLLIVTSLWWLMIDGGSPMSEDGQMAKWWSVITSDILPAPKRAICVDAIL